MTTLHISAQDYAQIRENLSDSNEVGGYFQVSGSQLIPVINSNGSSNSVHVSKEHPFVFHTHPGRCASKASCSLGVPSSQDMRQILDASTHGTVAHFVIAHEGMYVVQARCHTIQQYQSNKSIGDSIKKRFKDYQDKYSPEDDDYHRWVRGWVGFANSNGFSVHFYPIGSQLRFTVQSKCF